MPQSWMTRRRHPPMWTPTWSRSSASEGPGSRHALLRPASSWPCHQLQDSCSRSQLKPSRAAFMPCFPQPPCSISSPSCGTTHTAAIRTCRHLHSRPRLTPCPMPCPCRLRCVVCKRSVLDDIERGHNVDYGPYELHVCDCCQRCFHNKCCRAKGIRPPPDTEELEEEAAVAALVKQAAAIEAAEQQQDGTQQHDPAQQEQQEQEQQQQAEEEQQRPWFHSSQCAQVAAGLAEKVAAGDTALDSSRSLQLIPSREGAVKPDVDALTDVSSREGPRWCGAYACSRMQWAPPTSHQVTPPSCHHSMLMLDNHPGSASCYHDRSCIPCTPAQPRSMSRLHPLPPVLPSSWP